MKKIFISLFTILVCIMFIASCGEDKDKKELQKNIQEEQEAKEAAQQEAAESKSLFNFFIGISVAVTLIALIVGVAMGSKARKDANVQSTSKEDKDE